MPGFITEKMIDQRLTAWKGKQYMFRDQVAGVYDIFVNIINRTAHRKLQGSTSGFASTVGKSGADFKRQFTMDTYRQFFIDAGYPDVTITIAEGRIPCAVAVMSKHKE